MDEKIVIGADVGDVLTWQVDKGEVKANVCRFIDSEDWMSARGLLDGVVSMVLAHRKIQERISAIKPEGD